MSPVMDIFKDRENTSFEAMRILLILGCLVLLFLQVYSVIMLGREFNPIEFGSGFGGLLLGGGVGIATKDRAKPMSPEFYEAEGGEGPGTEEPYYGTKYV